MAASAPQEKKILENPLLAGMVVPLAVVLVGALLVFGITKMLSTDRNHRDLVLELQSKTFGNRWVAAYELSKLLATSKIPQEDRLWVVDNLSKTYKTTQDPRTRNFLVMAIGTLQTPQTAQFLLEAAQKDSDMHVRFNALVALGNYPPPVNINWEELFPLIEHADAAIRHATALALAQHRVEGSIPLLVKLTQDAEASVKYGASLALLNFQDSRSLPGLQEILLSQSPFTQNFDLKKQQELKLNALQLIKKNYWPQIKDLLIQMQAQESDKRVSLELQQILMSH